MNTDPRSRNADAAGRSARPWYREFWPWALMLPPLAAVAGGIAMIVLATHTPSALVVEDYARIEELTSQRFERDRQAVNLGLAATLSLSRDPGRVELSLSAPADFELPRALTLYLRHATNPDGDRELRLVRYGDAFAADVEVLPGRYRIEVMPEDRAWRLGAAVVRLEGRITLSAQTAEG